MTTQYRSSMQRLREVAVFCILKKNHKTYKDTENWDLSEENKWTETVTEEAQA